MLAIYLIILSFFSSLALGQTNIQGLPSATGWTFNYLEDARMLQAEKFYNFYYSYTQHPLLERNITTGQINYVVKDLHLLEVRAGFVFNSKLMASFDIPMGVVSLPGTDSAARLGDTTIQLKWLLSSSDSSTKWALVPELSIPTGSTAYYLSSGTSGWSVRLAGEKKSGAFTFATNLGYRNNPGAKLRNLDYSQQWIAGAGANLQMSERWNVNAEAMGLISIPFKANNSPGEYYVGSGYRLNEKTLLSAGTSLGGVNGDNDSFRFLMSAKILPDNEYKPEKEIIEIYKERPSTCHDEPVSVTYSARALNEQEQELANHLPYKTDVAVHSQGHMVTMNKLKIGEMTTMTPNGFPYVENAQVVFAIDIQNLPVREKIKKLDSALLKMEVKKISKDAFIGTEMICLLKPKVCSGEVISQAHWAKAVNWDFFGSDKKTANDYFSKQYMGQHVATWNGQKIYSSDLILNLNDVLKNSSADPFKLIYEPNSDLDKKTTLYFVVADDTYVTNNVRLELLLNTEVCE